MSNFQISARDQFDNPGKIFEQITYANPSGMQTTRHRRGVEPLAYNTFSLGEILMRSPAVGNPADALEKYQAIITGTMSSFWNSENMSVFNSLLPPNVREVLEDFSPDKEAGFGTDTALDGSDGGADGGNLGSFNIEGITPSTKSLPSGVRPVTRVGARVVREVLGFDGTIGGMRAYSNGESDHETGHAIDVMVGYGNARQKQQGDTIAEFFRHNRNALEIKYVIWYDRICSVRPDSKGNAWGWRPYVHPSGNRRDPTLRHLDHPHISFLNRPAPNNPRLEWPNGTMVGSRPVEAR